MNEWMTGAAMCLVGLAIITGGCILWRMAGQMGHLSGINARARDRERHDGNVIIEKMVEKMTCDPMWIANAHGHERANQARQDASMENEAARTASQLRAVLNKDEPERPDQAGDV